MATTNTGMSNKTFNKDLDDPYSTFYVENLLGGLNEWRNIQDIVRLTFKALCDIVKNQGEAIKDLQKQMLNKATKSELNSALSIKANVAEVMRTFNEVATNLGMRPTSDEIHSFLEEKVSKQDLTYYLNQKMSFDDVKNLIDSKVSQRDFDDEVNNLNDKIDEIHKDFNKKSSNYATQKELKTVIDQIETKANANEMNEALNSKANKESMIQALHKKANKNEIESLLKSKMEVNEFHSFVEEINQKMVNFNEIEKIQVQLDQKAEHSDLISFTSILNVKADLKDLEILSNEINETKHEISKKVETIDIDLDKLIESIKKEFSKFNLEMNNLEVKKADFNDLDKINANVSKKMDIDYFNTQISIIKNDLYDSFLKTKNENLNQRKIFEENLTEKISNFEKNFIKLNEETQKTKEKINNILEIKKNETEESLKMLKQQITLSIKDLNNELNVLRTELSKTNSDIQNLNKNKLEKSENEILRNKLFQHLEKKAEITDVDNLYSEFQKELKFKAEESRNNINEALKCFEDDIVKLLDKKANMYEVSALLNNKADITTVNLAIQNKVNVSEFESVKNNIDRLNRELNNKVDMKRFDALMEENRHSLDDLHKDVMMKANIKEILGLLKNKAEIDDVNKALVQIHEELDHKTENDQFNNAMDNQSIINDALCSENCVARWTWKSGVVRNGYAIPWEQQLINTAPENFLWEKDKTSVMVVNPGLYQLIMGFFADKKPTVQVLVNGEPILSAVNSASYVVHHSSGKMKNLGKHSYGLTLIDFVCLPERARISLSYSGEEGGEGFLGFKKL